MKVSNQVILITGASSGIGRATALELASYNNTIILIARREEKLIEVTEEVKQRGSRCTYYAGDALDEDFARKTVSDVVKSYGHIDIGILGVGIGPPSNTLKASVSQINKCMAFNYTTFINFYVPLINQMQKQDTECMISNVNSLASFFGVPMQGDYTAAKGAIRLFLETARMELKHFGIRHIHLQTIHPGFVDTEAVRNDGIPSPGEISEEQAAKYIVKGLLKNKKYNMFPFSMSFLVRVGKRLLPEWLVTKVQLGEVPKEY